MTAERITVACIQCGKDRTIVAFRKTYAAAAAARLCPSCSSKAKAALPTHVSRTQSRPTYVESQTLPFAKRYEADEAVVDWVVVDRLMSGQPAGMTTRPERVAAVAALTALGVPASAIAERMRLTQRSVERLRAVVREEVSRVA